MKYLNLLLYLAVAVSAAFAPSCTAKRRIGTAQNITAAFNEKDPLKSAAGIQALPLQRDCPAIVYVNNAPGIEFGFDAASTKNFAIVVRQAFTNVVSKYTDYNNGTTLMDAQVTLGVLGFVDTPIYAHILVPIEFNMATCQITKLPAFVYVPSDIGGNPVDPPLVPVIPGLETLPGLREVLKQLIPAIGNIYGL